MSSTTMGPKGGHRPNTAIAGGAIVYGTAVKRGADLNTLVQATNASVNQGIAIDDQPTAGRAFAFVDQPGEIVEARAGAAFALDALLMSDANGKLITCTTTNPVIAHALQAATAADQLVPVRLAQRGILAP
jgi:sulfate adenylyltransferase subunit 1 (EFTu-like GTPase family)